MVKKDQNTEKKILDAAKNVFESKGMYGARMQEIADEAGINKALLHYYFRSKEKLFEAVFEDAFTNFFPNLVEIFNTDKDIREKLEMIIDHYFNMISKNPFLPIFLITEVNREPECMKSRLQKMGLDIEKLLKILNALRDENILPDIDPRQIIVNLISLTIFPYLARPLLKPLLFENNAEEMNTFLLARKKMILQMLLNQ
ncbi:TetR/AcrR family transcriptional regulator [Saccharicrinis sp. FJH62]|uniref:TetR/AcrR family transcriptional regulator n=1 Tax=Saccharicrinis sp. FJH62 TaxID=3344657 RepID=UPI0035D4EE67